MRWILLQHSWVYFICSNLTDYYIFRALTAFDLLLSPLKLEWILLNEFKMTWELFIITIIKSSWQIFFFLMENLRRVLPESDVEEDVPQ